VLRYLVVALLLLAVPANAQFRATPPAGATDFPYSLTCGILKLAPGERDDDPVHMIVVKPGFKEEGGKQVLSDLSVVHISVFGRSFSRSDQYSNDQLSQAQGRLEVTWAGAWRKNPNVRMVGRLWHTDDRGGRWFYSESQSKAGRPEMEMLAGCHPTEAPEL
jgi:hypothetical protein